MSIRMLAGAARLTVLGRGWSSTPTESGSGFTELGELLKAVATDLRYIYGERVDWDLIADTRIGSFDWREVIYTDEDGNVYTDTDGDGVWTDPSTGAEYSGGGVRWLAKDQLTALSSLLEILAAEDAAFMQYSIPNDILATLYGGTVSEETNPIYTGAARPHSYSPAVWFIQQDSKNSVVFLDEPFYHSTADGESITVYDEAVTIRDGSTEAVYWSTCNTAFSDTYLESPYSDYPVQYVCWQCLHGSLSDALISKTDNTIVTKDIQRDSAGLTTMTIDGAVYYAINTLA